MSVNTKLEALRTRLRQLDKVLVCFSGGVDSTFLLKVAADELGPGCYALTCASETMARSELEDARRLAAELGLGDRHTELRSRELSRDGFADNPVDRCALCKTELMEHAGPLATRLGIEAVLLGTNVDDLGDYRPGIAAARTAGALSPMCEVGLNKAEIRALSKELGLRTWNKPQLACLSSRFPYGTRITARRLEQVDRLEDGLRELGFGQLRVRYHAANASPAQSDDSAPSRASGWTIARLSSIPDQLARAVEPEIRGRIVELATALGFTDVAVDLKGFRSGSLNEGGLVPLPRRAER